KVHESMTRIAIKKSAALSFTSIWALLLPPWQGIPADRISFGCMAPLRPMQDVDKIAPGRMMHSFPLEPRFLADLFQTAGEVSLVLGQSDVGKSTLIRTLIHHVTAQGESVAVLDADLGQSTFGLPTTLTLVRVAASRATTPEPIASVFVGAISPVGHLL